MIEVLKVLYFILLLANVGLFGYNLIIGFTGLAMINGVSAMIMLALWR